MAKMLGRLGWRGQCVCCSGPKDPKAIRAEEKRRWRREYGEPRRGLDSMGVPPPHPMPDQQAPE